MDAPQVLGAIVVLPVDNIARATEWYGRVLGFETVYLHEGTKVGEVTNYAIMVRDGVAVHLILDEPPPHDRPWTKAGTGYLYLQVRNVDEVFAEVAAGGGKVRRGVQTESWGARSFNLTDPSGNDIHIEQRD
jgi:uncharacterized glyoxalase superfamily protein PhnB